LKRPVNCCLRPERAGLHAAENGVTSEASHFAVLSADSQFPPTKLPKISSRREQVFCVARVGEAKNTRIPEGVNRPGQKNSGEFRFAPGAR
ncbi:MAG: hypothetical protein ACF8PG_07605, partial [Maioricimonas sp. JB045]